MPAVDQLLTTRELASRTGYSPGTLRNMRSEGRGLPYVRKMNGRVYYREGDVRAWEAQHSSTLVTP
jgi:predicted DNA-binding transcriptional regulator AlpA